MEFRSLLLKIMLWSLGFAAVTGVAMILISPGDVAWRVVGTAVATAVAAGLLIPASMMTGHKQTYHAGLLLVIVVIAEFIMSLVLIWDVIQTYFLYWGRADEQFAFTMVFVALSGVGGMVFLIAARFETWRLAGRSGTVLSAVEFVVLMIAVWFAFPRGDDRWWETALIMLIYGLLSVLCGVGVGDGRRYWRWVGVVASSVVFVLFMGSIWQDADLDAPLLMVTWVTLTCAAVATAHANLVLLCRLTDHQRWVRWSTIAAAIGSMGVLDLIVNQDHLWELSDGAEDFCERLSGALGIAAGCGTLAMVVLTLMNRRVSDTPFSTEITDIDLRCPRCSKKQTLPTGGGSCLACGLSILIRIEEPRCPNCDYLLYGKSSDRCPECGTLVGTSEAKESPA